VKIFRREFPLYAALIAPIPATSWESWINTIRNRKNEMSAVPARPDHKTFESELPLWVDCHLGYLADNPRGNRKLRLPKEIVLRASPKKCQGQIEEWPR